MTSSFPSPSKSETPSKNVSPFLAGNPTPEIGLSGSRGQGAVIDGNSHAAISSYRQSYRQRDEILELSTALTPPKQPTKRSCRDGGNVVVEAAGIELNQAASPNLLMTHAFAEFYWDF